MAFIKKTADNVGEDVEKREHMYTFGTNINCWATMENSIEGPKQVKIELSWSTNPTSGDKTEGNKILP